MKFLATLLVVAVVVPACFALTHEEVETDLAALMAKYAQAEWKDEFLSLIELEAKNEGDGATDGGDGGDGGGNTGGNTGGGTETGGAGEGTEAALVGSCEVCVYVIENKEQHQPYLCRGLKDPNYQKNCVQVMESLMWWLTNEVYWLNYGCQRSMNGAIEWVRPCPAHAVCSWIEELYTRQPFCPPDPYYKKPQ